MHSFHALGEYLHSLVKLTVTRPNYFEVIVTSEDQRCDGDYSLRETIALREPAWPPTIGLESHAPPRGLLHLLALAECLTYFHVSKIAIDGYFCLHN